jgi:hypothetical protein
LFGAAGTSEELRKLRVECAKFATEVAALRETLAVERGRTTADPPAPQRQLTGRGLLLLDRGSFADDRGLTIRDRLR